MGKQCIPLTLNLIKRASNKGAFLSIRRILIPQVL